MPIPDRFFDVTENRERTVLPPESLVFVQPDYGDQVLILPKSRFKKLLREVEVRDKKSGRITTGKELEGVGIVLHTGHNVTTPFDPEQHEVIEPAKADPVPNPADDDKSYKGKGK